MPVHGLRTANALMQQVMFGTRIVGPAVAAFLVASFGPVSCYLLDCVSFVGSALLIASVAFVQPATAGTAVGGRDPRGRPRAHPASQGSGRTRNKASTLSSTTRGLLFVIVALAAGMFVMGCFGPLIAVYVREDLHAATRIFGVASALIGVGMLIGINALGAFAKNVKNEVLVYSGLAGIALGLVILAAVARVWSTFLGDFVIGFAVAGIVIPSQTMIQQETPPALMGRVGATTMSMIFGAQISGLVLSGILAEGIGVRHVFAVCAVLLVLLIGAGCIWRGRTTKEQPNR